MRAIERNSFAVVPVRLVGLALACLILIPSAASALAPRRAEDPDRRIIPPAALDQVPEAAPEGGGGPAAAPAAAFRGRHPGAWSLTFDRRTGRPLLFEGRGVPFLPGSGNGLPASAFGLGAPPRSIDDADAPGRRFIDSEADLLRPPAGALILNRDRSLFDADGELGLRRIHWTIRVDPGEYAGSGCQPCAQWRDGYDLFVDRCRGHGSKLGQPGAALD